MADGTIYKRCGCRDPRTRKVLGNTCPKLRRANRSWNPEHGAWAYQLELPPTVEGRRRQLRRTGIPDHPRARDELDHARRALDLAGRDRRSRTEIADLLQQTVRGDLPLPDLEELRRRLGTGNPLAGIPTVAEWLTTWITKIKVDPNTVRSYESHLRMHLIPHLGDVRAGQTTPAPHRPSLRADRGPQHRDPRR